MDGPISIPVTLHPIHFGRTRQDAVAKLESESKTAVQAAEHRLNKHEVKTLKTRELLLSAAEEVFVREGYERADLGEIAKIAGRTKGAIYAQFHSKEHMFIELVRQHALRRRSRLVGLLEPTMTKQHRLKTFRKYFVEGATEEKAWPFLLLEFRLHALRNPESKAGLMKVFEELLPGEPEATYSNLLGSPSHSKEHFSRMVAINAGFAMLNALLVERSFDPKLLDKRTMQRIAGGLFDLLFV